VLVTGERGGKGFAFIETREVEGLGPAVLIQLCCAIVIAYDNGSA
jgi:hypothetical protein